MKTAENIRFKLSADISEFTSGLNKASAKLKSAGAKMTSIGQGMSVGITAPVLAVGAGIVKFAGDFDQAMASVKAVTRATGGEFNNLRDLAMQLGSTTQFSASEAAAGIEMLAKNGMAVTDILNGAAQASLNLAAATGTDLSSAADIATDAMSLFKLNVEDMDAAVSDITAVTLNSKFGVEDYAGALAQAGGMAGKVGVSFDDFNASIAIMADSFKSGSDAGTAYKTFLGRLVPQSKEASAAMERLGLEFFDSAGMMKPMQEIAQELQDGFKGLNDASKIELAGTIFGQDAIRAALDLAEGGEAAFVSMDKLLGAVDAADVAADKMDNFNGKIKELWSSIEYLAIVVADAGLLDWLTGLVEKATAVTRAIADGDGTWIKWGLAIGVVAAVLGPLIITVGAIVTAIGTIGAPIAAAIAGFAAATAAVALFWGEIKAAYEWVVKLISKMGSSVLGVFGFGGGGQKTADDYRATVAQPATTGATTNSTQQTTINFNQNVSRSDATTIAAEAQRRFLRG